MLRNLGLDLDLSKVGKDIKVQLALPNKTITKNINHIVNASLDNVEINGLPTFTFEIPHMIEKRTQNTDSFELVKNKDIKAIKEKMLIKITWYNKTREDWFVISELKETDSEDSVHMSVTAEYLPSELRSTNITVEKESIDVQEYFNFVLGGTAWKLGNVSNSLKQTYRTFEDGNKKSRYEAVLDGIETYGAIADWDCETRTLNLRDIAELKVFRGVVLKKENYASSIEVTSNTDELVTRLYVYGNEELGIESANPTGMPYIEDFSYFMYPFERDANKNVIKSSNYMSDGLCHALLDLKALQTQHNPEIKSTQVLINNAYSDLSAKMIQKTDKDGQLITLQALLDTAKATGDTNLIYQREMEIRDKEAEITALNTQINNIKHSIDTWEQRIVYLQELVSVNSFTPALKNELSLFVYEKEVTDDRYIDAQELYEFGQKEFEKYQTPIKSFNIELVSFINSLESQHLKNRLQIGEEVKIKSTKLDTEYTSIVLGYSVDFTNGDYNLVISDNLDDINSLDKLSTLLYKSESSSYVLQGNKYKWDNIITVKDEVEKWRTDEIKAVEKRILAGANESISIDNRGIQAHNPDFPNERIIIQSGVVALSKDGGKTWSTSMTPDGVIAERLIGKILAGNNLIITNDSGSFTIDNNGLTVDMDSIRIMSGQSGTPKDVIDEWNKLLLTYDEISSDSKVNPYEKTQLKKQFETLRDNFTTMVVAIQNSLAGSQTQAPPELQIAQQRFNELDTYLNTTKQTDGYAILAETNMDKTTTIVASQLTNVFKNYEVARQNLETIMPLYFAKSEIQLTEQGISLNYVKNNEVVTRLNLSDEGVKIDGKLLEINSDTEFNANLTMNAGVIRGKDNGIIIDLNNGTMTLNKPLTIGAGSNIVTTEQLNKLKEQYTLALSNDSVTVPTDENGNNGDYQLAVTKADMYKQGVIDNSNWTWNYTASTGVIVNSDNATQTYRVTSMSVDTGSITVRAVKDAMVFEKVFTVTKARKGSSGSSASLLTLDTSAYVMTFTDKNVASPASQSITVKANLTNLSGTPTFLVVPYIGSVAQTPLTKTVSNNTVAITQADMAGNVDSIKITSSLSGKSDTVTIAKLKHGGQAVTVSSIEEKYAVNNSSSTVPTTWSNTPVATTTATPYLWNYEIFNYSDGTKIETAKRVIGVHGATGDKGDQGTKGIPGEKGADGRTPYVHYAYSWSFDGKDRFTTTYPNPNLFSKKYANEGKYLNSDGTMTDNAEWGYSFYIPIGTGTTHNFVVSGFTNLGISPSVCFYDSNLTFISGVKNNGTNANRIITPPTNATYFMFSYQISDKNTLKIEIGTTHTIYTTNEIDDFLNAYPTYSGMYTDYTELDSNNYQDYEWSRIKGEDGSVVEKIENFYLANNVPANQTRLSGGWTTTPQSTTITNKYLWNYEKLTYTNGTVTYSTPVIIGTHGATGADGTDGKDAVTAILTNEAITLPASSSGVVSSFSTATGIMQIYEGTARVTTGVVYSIISQTGCTASVNAINGTYTITAMSGDTAVLKLNARYKNIDYVKEVTLAKSKAGNDGVSVVSVQEKYAINNSSTTAPTAWQDTPPATTTSNRYLWNYEIFTYSNGQSQETKKRVIGVHGATGSTGTSGTSITNVENYYLISANNTGITTSTSGWSLTPQVMTPTNKYLWNYEKVTFSDNTVSNTAPSIIGVHGERGEQGIKGEKGADGTQYYTWLKYADTPTSGMSDSPTGKAYIGLAYNKTTSAESSVYSDYQWFLVKGAKGDKGDKGDPGNQGIPGTPGADGRTPYTHWAYAWSADGTDRFTTVYPPENFLRGSSAEWQDYNFTTWTAPSQSYELSELGLSVGDTLYVSAEYDVISGTGAAMKVSFIRPGLDTLYLDPNRIPVGTKGKSEGSRTIPSGTESIIIRHVQGSDGTTRKIGKFRLTGVYKSKVPVDWTPAPADDFANAYPTFAGTYTDYEPIDSEDPSKYTWQRILGESGQDGKDGIAGKDGVGLKNTTIQYAQSTNGVTAPTTGWTSNVPTLVKGQYLWTKTIWAYTDNTSETGYTVSYNAKDGNNGSDGIAGKDGVGIKSTNITYAQSTNGTTAPTSGWTSTIPNVPENSFLWTRTIWTYTDNTNETGYTVAKMGAKGDQGVPGVKGADGIQRYTWIKYGTNASGAGISDSPTGKTYIGLAYNKTTATESTNPADYAWSLIQGDRGDDGQNAENYYINTSHNIIKRSMTNVLNPTSLTITGYRKIGTSNPTTYACRFRILTSVDGSSFTQRYVSSADQTTSSYAIPNDVNFVSTEMYVAGGTTTLLDTQTIPVVNSAEDLEIGGRNLLLNTSFSKGTLDSWNINGSVTGSIDSTNQFEGVNSLKLVFTASGAPSGSETRLFQHNSTGASNTFMMTSSAYVKADKEVVVGLRNGGSVVKRITIGTSWQKISQTEIGDKLLLWAESACTLWVAKPKTEKGNQSADWTPAPEDSYLYTAWANSPDGKVDFTRVYPRPNLIIGGRGNSQIGAFQSFDNVTDDYAELTLSSNKTYASKNIAGAFELKIRDYTPGQKVTWSYDFMYTKWNMPAGTKISEFWMGQRFGTPSWMGVTQHNLPRVGEDGVVLNQWKKMTTTLTIPTMPDESIPSYTSIQFYNSAETNASFTIRIKNLKLEYGDDATPFISNYADNTPLDAVPQYVGVGSKDTMNPADFVWSVSPEYTKAIAEKNLSDFDTQINESITGNIENLTSIVENKVENDEVYQTMVDLVEALNNAFQKFTDPNDGQAVEMLNALEERTASLIQNLGETIAEYNFINTYMKLGDEGFMIGKQDGNLRMLLTDNRLSFVDGDTEVAYFSNQEFKINRGAIVQSLQIGTHKFTDLKNGHTVVGWTGAENLIKNGSFERGTEFWLGAPEISIYGYTGSCLIRRDSGINMFRYSDPITVVPNQRYIVSYYFNNSSDFNGSFGETKFRISDDSENHLASVPITSSRTSWTKIEAYWTCPSNITSVRVQLVFANTAGWGKYDDVVFKMDL